MGKIEELVLRAKELGQTFIAITDHGSCSGLWEAQQTCAKHGIKLILGTEFYYQRETDDKNGHLIVLAKNEIGLKNIFKLQEYAYVHNFYKKPRIDFDTLVKHKEGIIVTSACLASTICQEILQGNLSSARKWAKKFRDEFGDDFYLEVQPNMIPEQSIVNRELIRIAKDLNISFIATNDTHYVYESDAYAHEVMLALQTNKKMNDPSRWKFSTNDFWLKSEDEMLITLMLAGVDKTCAEVALFNTSLLADKCNAELKRGKYLPPYHSIPHGDSERSLLVKKTVEGVKRTNKTKDKSYLKDVQNEIEIIDRNGYCGYFLIVSDYVTTARSKGVVVGDGRGSGAGSKVAYSIDISRIDPSKYDLLFERFMADGRTPDFDVDFSDQDAVFDDLVSKYGIENVARIIAFGTMTPKAVCRKVLSAFDAPTDLVKNISSLIPNNAKTLQQAYEENPALLVYKKESPKLFDVIERLEGRISHESQHAGGVIIYPNLSEHLPIKTIAENRQKRIVAFDKYMLEDMGHYKFDILGLETLPIIRRCTESIKTIENIEIDLYNINYEDANVYKMLGSGDVSGVFQLANQAQKVIEQQPKNFKDLIAINALIRPGTGDWEEYIRRRKGAKWSVLEQRMPYLEETVGLVTYQEQFLLDCKVLAGWDIAFADKHVRKNKNIIADIDLGMKFINDCTLHGISLGDSQAVWDEIMKSVDGGYTFNKSHSASYAVLSYQTAWLKHYYPKHFYASLMSSAKTDGDGQSEIANYIAECKNKGINILPPDINRSTDEFVVSDMGIAYRITAISHVGESAIKNILSLRPIKSFDDFMERREKKHIKQNVLVNLIKAGCFDFDNPNRGDLLNAVESTKKNFIPYDYNDSIKAEWEKEVLGLYLSSHPLDKYGFKQLNSYGDGDNCLAGGILYDLKIFNDKKGNEMAFGFIDTIYGNIKLLFFSRTWANKAIKKCVDIGTTILVRGKKSGSDIIVDSLEELI